MAEGGVATSFTVEVTDQPFAFDEGATSADPVVVAATAGETFSRTFTVSGAADPADVRYELRGPQGEPLDDTFARNGFDVAIDPESGVLSGRSTAATSFHFQVVATSGTREAVSHVEVSIAPGALARIAVGVAHEDSSGLGADSWGVVGDVITFHPGSGGSSRTVDAIPARQGDRVQVRAWPVDAFGNPVGDHTDLRITSDVASDRIEYVADQAATRVTFEHASPHTITIADGAVTSTVRFEVTPSVEPAASVTTPRSGGTLAYTGADESGPLAWAIGLLAAGAGLVTFRIRRRRA